MFLTNFLIQGHNWNMRQRTFLGGIRYQADCQITLLYFDSSLQSSLHIKYVNRNFLRAIMQCWITEFCRSGIQLYNEDESSLTYNLIVFKVFFPLPSTSILSVDKKAIYSVDIQALSWRTCAHIFLKCIVKPRLTCRWIVDDSVTSQKVIVLFLTTLVWEPQILQSNLGSWVWIPAIHKLFTLFHTPPKIKILWHKNLRNIYRIHWTREISRKNMNYCVRKLEAWFMAFIIQEFFLKGEFGNVCVKFCIWHSYFDWFFKDGQSMV
jgi:hypothetical protein